MCNLEYGACATESGSAAVRDSGEVVVGCCRTQTGGSAAVRGSGEVVVGCCRTQTGFSAAVRGSGEVGLRNHFATLPTYVAPACAIVQAAVPLKAPL